MKRILPKMQNKNFEFLQNFFLTFGSVRVRLPKMRNALLLLMLASLISNAQTKEAHVKFKNEHGHSGEAWYYLYQDSDVYDETMESLFTFGKDTTVFAFIKQTLEYGANAEPQYHVGCRIYFYVGRRLSRIAYFASVEDEKGRYNHLVRGATDHDPSLQYVSFSPALEVRRLTRAEIWKRESSGSLDQSIREITRDNIALLTAVSFGLKAKIAELQEELDKKEKGR